MSFNMLVSINIFLIVTVIVFIGGMVIKSLPKKEAVVEEKQSGFKKKLIILLLFTLFVFTVVNMIMFYKVGSVPDTLIIAVFGLLTVEFVNIAVLSIKEDEGGDEV